MIAMQQFATAAPEILAALDESPARAAGVLRQALSRFGSWDLPLGYRDGGTWILVVPKKLDSPNQTIWRHWRVLNKARQDWEHWLWATAAKTERCASPGVMRELGRAPACQIPMRSTVFRFVASVRQFIKDDDNLAFSVKHANDSMKRIGLVKDDNRTWLTVSLPVQDVSPIAGHAITVFILRPAEVAGLFAGAPDADRPLHTPPPCQGSSDDRRTQEGRTLPGVRRRARARAADV